MDNYRVVELDNNDKYVIVDALSNDGNNYLLLSKLSDDEQEISKDLIYCKQKISDGIEYLEIIEDEKENEFVKTIFETKLDNI